MEIQTFSECSKTFATNIFVQLSNRDNLIISPFSIQLGLAMVRVGAVNETAVELDTVLCLTSNIVGKIGDIYHNILNSYRNSDILKLAIKIYVMENFTLKTSYEDIIKNKFLADVEKINFTTNVEAAKTMNAWVEEKTNNKVHELVKATAIGEDTRIVLLNSIYFNGKWLYKFPKSKTRTEDFYINDINTTKVSMMNLKKRFSYAYLDNLNAKVLKMDYKNCDLSMLVILPDTSVALQRFKESLDTFNLSDVLNKMTLCEVLVKFPKFSAEFTIELNETLQKMGILHMFTGGDLTNMLEVNDLLKVSKVIHKAYIEINEGGTQAAASTGLITDCTNMEFFANRPFFYFIINSKKCVFFAGSYHNPT